MGGWRRQICLCDGPLSRCRRYGNVIISTASHSVFNRNIFCIFTVGLWTDNSSMAVSYFQQTICLKWWFALPNLSGGSRNSTEEDLQQTVNNKPAVCWDQCGSRCISGCTDITIVGLSYLNKVWPAGTRYPVTYSDMVCLRGMWNMFPSNLYCNATVLQESVIWPQMFSLSLLRFIHVIKSGVNTHWNTRSVVLLFKSVWVLHSSCTCDRNNNKYDL